MKENDTQQKKMSRPPVVAVMGHIDHGKSTLLDYIRKTKVTEKEAGGITQHLGAYEVTHVPKDGPARAITFLDTPGHEAFRGIRARGAIVADVAVLVVSAEDGVKPQTIEARDFILKQKLPYIVALTKIDKPQADVPRAKQSLAENQIYVEGYGGDIPCVPVSGKTGEGVPELLDMVLLVADLKGITANPDALTRGFIIESGVDVRKGISATAILVDGALRKGMCVVAENAYAPTRQLENSLGKPISEISAGLPVRIFCWNRLPRIGAELSSVACKRDAEDAIEVFVERTAAHATKKRSTPAASQATATALGQEPKKSVTVPIVLKADAAGSLEALEHELEKRTTEKVHLKIIQRGIGAINEGDAKAAASAQGALLIGFTVATDAAAAQLIERDKITAASFSIIYELCDWLTKQVAERTPKELIEEVTGSAKVLKIFSTEKDRQVVGGRVQSGTFGVGGTITVWRRDARIGTGKIRELQRFKEKVSSVPMDTEFGAYLNSTVEVMPGDRIEAFTIIEK